MEQQNWYIIAWQTDDGKHWGRNKVFAYDMDQAVSKMKQTVSDKYMVLIKNITCRVESVNSAMEY